jgi:signal transduction histidine kinase
MDFATDGDAARRFISVIDRQSARLQELVSDLLDLARLESVTIRFEPQNIAVRELLSDLEQHFAQRVAEKSLRWRADRSGCARAHIRANPQLLRLVLDNLIDNAIKYTERGGEVGIICREAEDRVDFEVFDTGCGIPADEQERVFERFYQVERARSGHARGTGLGLAIVRHAVAAMNGDVHLSSRQGEGTRVTVALPQSKDSTQVRAA